MVSDQSENLAHGEVESAPPPPAPPDDDPPKTHNLSSLGRQSSIYSLTLDEFQHTLCENGKNFGSMNMDEFLSNIWTAEENQAVHSNNETLPSNQNDPTGKQTLKTHPSLPRQGSITLPAPLCRKTVEEVWSEIHRDQQQQQQQQQQHHQPNVVGNTGPTHRQTTFGEMTLEDFLIRAGVVREAVGSSAQHQLVSQAPPPAVAPTPGPPQYGVYQGNNTGVDPNFGIGPVMGLGFTDPRNSGNGVTGGLPAYQAFPHTGGVMGETSNYGGNGKRSGGFPTSGVCYSGRVGNGGGGGGGYTAAQTLAMGGSPVSPVSSDGMCGNNQMDNTANQYGMEMGGMRGRKRIIDGPVEKVVERRQRRMIKNRESAARSRARKQVCMLALYSIPRVFYGWLQPSIITIGTVLA
ncbi:Basic-leucine zipper domain [Macleaya cordata]|uniref:Basic-leucine zipper domain n=1 Tax=Macleaya cordata TaxID=56857 RepID=A0A200Q695_MACCD|nr:Basic-leucine zipper domain [Macleaya cordata]